MVQSRKKMNRKQKRGGKTYQQCYDWCDPYSLTPNFNECLESMGCNTIKKEEEAANKQQKKRKEKKQKNKQQNKRKEKKQHNEKKRKEKEQQ